MIELFTLIAILLVIVGNVVVLWIKLSDLAKEVGTLSGRVDGMEKRLEDIERRLDRSH